MKLGELIRAWREHNEMSRRELSRVIGVDHVSLARFEDGETQAITYKNFAKIIVWALTPET